MFFIILKVKILWIHRVLEYVYNYFILELPRSLDFSRRSRDKKSLSESSGYALTSQKKFYNKNFNKADFC